jgi:hypothetical protein
MTFLTRNILDFYKLNEKNEQNHWYLEKFFSNTDQIGFYPPEYEFAIASEWDGKKDYLGTVDPYNEYKINNLGFRGNINKNSEVITSGCSITFGIGVPESARWTNFLSKKINEDVTNLGSPGGSVESICNNIIQYSLNNKIPKAIFCLFPDLFRRMVVVDKEFYITKKDKDRAKKDNLQYLYCNSTIVNMGNGDIFMEVEDKKYVEDSVSPHQLILNSINAIYLLESFCLLNNIKLYWTTWDPTSSLIINELKNIKNFKLKNFTPFIPVDSNKGIGELVNQDCLDDHNSEFKNDICWHRGADYAIVNRKKNDEVAHPGIHIHQHLSDFFYDLYNNTLTS